MYPKLPAHEGITERKRRSPKREFGVTEKRGPRQPKAVCLLGVMAAYGGVGMGSLSGHMGGDDDPTTDYDEGAIRFGSMGDTTMLTEAYVTTAMHMAKDLNDPFAYENKPLHYIPGYTGHLPLNRERFGVNYREASAATIAMQKAKGVHNPVIPLDAPPPNHVRAAAGPCVGVAGTWGGRSCTHAPAALSASRQMFRLPLPCATLGAGRVRALVWECGRGRCGRARRAGR